MNSTRLTIAGVLFCWALAALPAFAESCQQRAKRITALAPNSDYQCFENGARLFILKWSGRQTPPDSFFVLAGEALGGFADIPAPIMESMARSCHGGALRSGKDHIAGAQFTVTCTVRSTSTSVEVNVEAPSSKSILCPPVCF
jgi:hypothetical protein